MRDTAPETVATAIRALARGKKRSGASLDSRSSIDMVARANDPNRALARITSDRAPSPMSAARRWLGSDLAKHISPETRELALDLINHAEAHYREIDVMAADIARMANGAGAIDTRRVASLEQLLSGFALWSSGLRETLALAETQPLVANERLAQARAVILSGAPVGATTQLLSGAI